MPSPKLRGLLATTINTKHFKAEKKAYTHKEHNIAHFPMSSYTSYV